MLVEATERVEPLLSCALTGIVRATMGVQGGLPLVHGPMSCASGHRPIPLQAGQEPLIPTTTLTEIDLVRGTNNQLEESIRELHTIYSPKLIAVILTCATSLISENYEYLLNDLSVELGCLILAIDGSDMAGDEVAGYRLFTQALEDKLEGNRSIAGSDPDGICLRGLSPTDYGMAEERSILTSIIEDGLGVSIGATLFWDFDIDVDAQILHKPSVYCGWLWTEGDNWLPAPYGAIGTLRWLSGIAHLHGLTLREEVQDNLSQTGIKCARLQRDGDLNSMRVAIEGLSWWAVGLASFLQEELGCTVMLTTDQAVLEYRQRHGFTADTTLVDVGNFELLTYLDEFQPEVVFGSSYVCDGPWHWIPFFQPVWHPTDESKAMMGPQGAFELTMLLAEIRGRYA